MIAKFVPGRTYYTRSIVDSDHIITVRVLSRTAKTIKAATSRGVHTLRISLFPSGIDTVEQVKPWGSYSMAPIVSADRELAPTVFQLTEEQSKQ